ncbi:hypothetical protein BDW22DRAFT_842386 [Trametopsis cervina]|nr:hypothetical protein BDW22DRAFT_842386 [Trametopsis cervina]
MLTGGLCWQGQGRIGGRGQRGEGQCVLAWASLGTARAGNGQLRRPSTYAENSMEDETDGRTAASVFAHSLRCCRRAARTQETTASHYATTQPPPAHPALDSARRSVTTESRTLGKSTSDGSTPALDAELKTGGFQTVKPQASSLAQYTAGKSNDSNRRRGADVPHRVPTILINRQTTVNRQPLTPSLGSEFSDSGTQSCAVVVDPRRMTLRGQHAPGDACAQRRGTSRCGIRRRLTRTALSFARSDPWARWKGWAAPSVLALGLRGRK